MEINGGIIHRIFNKCKALLADDLIYFSLILCFTALASFGLGRLSLIEGSQASVYEANAVLNTGVHSDLGNESIEIPRDAADAYYVGSKNSDKYHLPWCSGANRIAEANKIIWQSREEAEAAGYSPAVNCKGL